MSAKLGLPINIIANNMFFELCDSFPFFKICFSQSACFKLIFHCFECNQFCKLKTFFFRRERLKGGTPKRTKAAWPEKATSENATCDENMFLFLGKI